jgi:hypothetical protein
VQAVRAALANSGHKPIGEIDHRVAVSVAHLGLVARLIAVTIGAAALTGHNIRLTADELWWQDDLGGPYPLSIAESFDCGDPLRGSAAEALTEAVVAQRACSEHVLWGNVASAANTAARLIAVARPDLARLAADIADTILSDRRVDGGSARSGPRFRRRSCCLIYRIAGTKQAVCGDCILAAQPSRD